MKALGAKFLLIVMQLWICSAEDKSLEDLKCVFVDHVEPYGYTANFIAYLRAEQHLPGKSDSSVNAARFFRTSMDKIPNGLFERFKNLQYLAVHVSNMIILNRNSMKGAKNLVELQANANFIERLEADTFADSVQMKNIDLSDNEISFVDVNAFRELDKLERLVISRNYIKTLHKDTFGDLLNLKDVLLDQNMLEELPEGLFRNNLNLEEIILSNNKIKIIPANLFENLNKKWVRVNLRWNLCINQLFMSKYFPLSTLNNEIRACN